MEAEGRVYLDEAMAGHATISAPRVVGAYIVLGYDDGTQAAHMLTAKDGEGMLIAVENARTPRGSL